MGTPGIVKIGIDGRSIGDRVSGISRYVTELCRSLDEAMPQARFYVYSLKPVHMPMPSERWIVRGEPSALGRPLSAAPLTSLAWFRYRVGGLCKLDGVSVFWGAQSLLPRLRPDIRSLITVYDLNLALVPRTMPRRAAISQSLLLKRSLAEATAICTISQGTAKRLRDLVGYKTHSVITPGVSDHFRPRPQEEVSACLRRYNVKRPYLMALGTWEPRKNIPILVKTFIQMKADGHLANYTLTLVGGRGWRDAEIVAMVHKAAEGNLLPLGSVPDTDLPALYSGCAAFVFPSIYEGFGIPVLEARACGARVVATDIPEIREAGDDDTIYVEPTAEGLRAGIRQALGQQKGQIGPKSKPNTWKESAAALGRLLLDLGS
jgi:glycosyltransferase involved in cell wall biosynthesis